MGFCEWSPKVGTKLYRFVDAATLCTYILHPLKERPRPLVEISVTMSRVGVAVRDLHVGEHVHHSLQHYEWQQYTGSGEQNCK
jgi:hypothetical protein